MIIPVLEQPAVSRVQSLQVHIATQRLKLLFEDGRMRLYPVSTAKKGINNQRGSNGTPLGWHRIWAKFGAAQQPGMVFAARQPTGQIAQIENEAKTTGQDLITSRILWLDGLEKSINKGGDVDSKGRYIYIHGTNEEGLIGTPASRGCIRMTNSDVIELFDLVPLQTRVLIVAN